MFALILMENGTYNICDIKRICRKRKNNTCMIKFDHDQPRKARLLACNENYEVLIAIKKALNTGSPKVRVTNVSNHSVNSVSNLVDDSVPLDTVIAQDSSGDAELRYVDVLPTNLFNTNRDLSILNGLNDDDTSTTPDKRVTGDGDPKNALNIARITGIDKNEAEGHGDGMKHKFLGVKYSNVAKYQTSDVKRTKLCLLNRAISDKKEKQRFDNSNGVNIEPNSSTDNIGSESQNSIANTIDMNPEIGDISSESVEDFGNDADSNAKSPAECFKTKRQGKNRGSRKTDSDSDSERVIERLKGGRTKKHPNSWEKKPSSKCLHPNVSTRTDFSIDSDPNWEPNIDRRSTDGYGDDSGHSSAGNSERGYSGDSDNGKKKRRPKKDLSKNTSIESQRLSLSFTTNCPGKSSCDDTGMIVQSSRGKTGLGKQHFCFFCHTKHTKIARHLQKKHGDQPRVQAFLLLPVKCAERRELITKLRHDGDFIFNVDPELNDGERIVARRPNPKYQKSATDYLYCANCKGSYSKKTARIHFRKCTGLSSQKTRLVTLSSKLVAGRIHSSATDLVRRRIIPVLREDDVTKLIRYDELIIGFANKQCKKYRSEHFDKIIRQRLRMLGRFLLTLRRCNPNVTDFQSIFNPEIYDDSIRAVNLVSGLNEETNEYSAPSTASLLGTLIKQIGKTHISECIKKKKNDKLKDAENYLKLLNEDYGISVNKTVTENQAQQQRRKTVVIPSMSDIKKLHDYLKNERTKAVNNLKKGFSMASWRHLGETTLTSIQLFNRRRAGEIERILIEDFNKYRGVDKTIDKDLYNALSENGKLRACQYIRFEIRGKLNRNVPVLLSAEILQCIQLFLKHRREAHVRKSNPYVFGVPSINTVIHKHLDSCLLMRNFSSECGAINPESLRGTELRKHMATKCLSLNLNETDVGEVADFMGHSTDIHKNVYRQTIVSREITKMSRLLGKAQGEEYDSEQESECHEKDGSDTSNVEDDKRTSTENEKSNEFDISDLNTTPSVPRKLRGYPSKRKNKRKRTGYGDEKSPAKKQRRSSSPHGPIKRVAWTLPQKDTILKQYGAYISSDSKTFPSLKTIADFIKNNPILQTRTAQQVKTWMSNQKQANKKLEYA